MDKDQNRFCIWLFFFLKNSVMLSIFAIAFLKFMIVIGATFGLADTERFGNALASAFANVVCHNASVN